MGTIFLLIYQQQKVVKETSNMLPPKLNLKVCNISLGMKYFSTNLIKYYLKNAYSK